MSRHATGQLLRLRLFLERIEIPVIAANVVATEGSAATAQIEIVPTDRALDFLPRTKVHLFYVDVEELEYQTDQPETIKFDDAGEIIPDKHSKLLFTGELFSLAYVKTGYGSRSVVLQCLDDSNYWDTSYLYMTTFREEPNQLAQGAGNAIVGNRRAFLTASDVDLLDDITNQVPQVIERLAKEPPSSPSQGGVRGDSMLGGLLNILEVIGGVPNLFLGLNDWHTISERRVRLLDQIGSDSGATAAGLFNATTFTNFIKNDIGQMGDVVSFRDIINLINSFVYYAVVPLPVARYVAGSNEPITAPAPAILAASVFFGDVNTSVVLQMSDDFSGNQKTNAGIIESVFLAKGLPREIIAAAIVNAVAESGLSAEADNDGGRTNSEGLRADGTPAHSVGLFQINDSKNAFGVKAGTVEERKNAAFNAEKILTDKGVAKVRQLYDGGERDVAKLARAWAILVERPANAPIQGDRRAALAGEVFPKDAQPVSTAPVLATPSVEVQESKTRERLITQIFRPDIWFVPPPLCNVVFPEEYNSLQFSRQLMREITRLELETFDQLLAQGGNLDKIISTFFFAPELLTAESLKETGIGSANTVFYNHEKFSGVVPRLEKISNLSFFAAKDASDVEGTEAGRAASPIERYGSQTAAFNFLRYRFAARSAEVSGRFMPRIACGFPALVVNRPQVVNDVPPIHFIGLVTSVTHSLNQEGGTTSFSMAYARPHVPDETDRFIHDLKVRRPVAPGDSLQRIRKDGVIERTTNFDVRQASNADQLTLARWISNRAEAGETKVAEKDSRAKGLTGPTGFPVLRIDSIDGVPVDTSAQVSQTVQAQTAEVPSLSETVDEKVVSSSNTTYAFTNAVVVEDVSGVIYALEDAIRPPWISEDYANPNIGKRIYQPLLGCDSLVDTTTLESLREVIPNAQTVSVEFAATALVGTYSAFTEGGQTATPWIWALTHRPVATQEQVLGSFHRFASGDFSNLEGLNLDVDLGPKIGDTGNKRRVDPSFDPRKDRYRVVLAYAQELQAFRALRG